MVLEEGESLAAGVREANDLLLQLGLDPAQLLEGSYADLLAAAGKLATNPWSAT